MALEGVWSPQYRRGGLVTTRLETQNERIAHSSIRLRTETVSTAGTTDT